MLLFNQMSLCSSSLHNEFNRDQLVELDQNEINYCNHSHPDTEAEVFRNKTKTRECGIQLNDTLKVRELQLRLHHRNQLLDVIRKAYHRDVSVIREALIRLSSNADICNKAEYSNPISGHATLVEILKSVPSIDLRNDGFFLLYPEECHLYIRPCFYCGGSVELVHCESARIVSLLESCDSLKVREEELQKIVFEKDNQLHTLQKQIATLNSEALRSSVQQETRIKALEQNLADYAMLLEKCRYQEEQIESMEEICDQKAVVDRILIELEREKQEQYCLLLQSNTELNNSNLNLIRERDEALSQIRTLTSHAQKLEIRNQEMCDVITRLEELEQQLQVEVEATKRILSSRTLALKRNEGDQRRLRAQLECLRCEYEKQIHDLSGLVDEGITRTSNLELELQNARNELNELRIHYSNEIDQREQAESIRSTEAKNTINAMTDRVNLLVNLSSSYIRGLFDNCHAQEEMLRVENFLPKRHKRYSHTDKTNGKKNFDQGNQNVVQLLQHNLEDGADSNSINWESILENEDDKRKVLVYLNNRMQMNQHQYCCLISKLHKRYENKTKILEEHYQKDLKTEIMSYHEKNKEVLVRLEEKESTIKDLTRTVDDLRNALENQISSNEILRLNDEERSKTIETLINDKCNLLEKVSTMTSELSALSDNIRQCQDQITQYRKDINFRDETLLRLEGCLQKTTKLYNQRLEDDAHRLATNESIGIQVTPKVSHVQQQIDFVDSTAST